METLAEVHQTISTVRPESVRGVSLVLNLSNLTVRKILPSVLNMFPFRFQCVQMLEAGDNQLWLDFANKFFIRYDEDSSWPLRILWSDKAHFTLTGNVNSKNCVHWADKNPHVVFATLLHDENVWCGTTVTFILGPYFFEEVVDGDQHTCTITLSRHVNSLCHSRSATAKCSI